MKNCFIMAPDNRPSILEEKLLEAFKNKKDADFFYSKLRGDDFKSLFGDWEQRYDNIDNPNVVITGKTYSNGEPMLFKVDGAEQYYVQLPDGTAMFLNTRGLRGAFKPSEIKEVSRYFLFKYVQYGGVNSFNNIDSKDSQVNMMSVINEGIKDLRSQQNNLKKERHIRIFGSRVDKIERFKDEFRAQLTYELDSLGQKFKEKSFDEEGNPSNEVPEDSRIGGVTKKESITVNQKDTATVNTKIMLSQLRSKKMNKKTGKKEFVKSPYLGTPVFEDFDSVWDSLLELLADKNTASIGGEMLSSYSQMKKIVNDITDIYPWAEDLNTKLDDLYNGDENQRYKAFEFVQAFNNTKVYYYVTEIDKKNSKYNVYNATSTNSRESYVLNKWGTSFANKFLDNSKKPKLNSEHISLVQEIRDEIIGIHNEFNNRIKDTQDDREARNSAIIYGAKNLFKNLSLLGFNNLELEDVNRFIYLGGGVSNEVTTMNKLFESVDFMIKDNILGDFKDPIVFLDADGNSSNPFRNQTMVKTLAKAVAMKEDDVSEKSIVGPNGKGMFAFSSPTYISSKISEWRADESELQSLMSQTVNKSSRWMKYLLANHIKNNEKARKDLSKKRMASFRNVLSSSFTSKGKGDAVDNTKISLEDQMNDNLSKSLRGAHTEGGSIFPSIIAGDKSRRMEFVGLEYINSRIFKDKDGNTQIPPRTVGIFGEYFFSEYERMLEVAKELDRLPENEKINHYHLGNVNGLKSQIFPELSHENLTGELRRVLYNKDGTPRKYETAVTLSDRQKEAVLEHIEKSLKKRYEETKIEINNLLKDTSVDSNLINYYKKNGGATAMTGDYMVNGMVATIEYTKMFSGDPAYYKNQAELIKRMPGTYTDGLQLVLDKNDDIFFNTAIVESVRADSAYKKLIEDSLSEKNKSIADAYSGVNTTDAQAWITPRRWRFLKQRLGQWSDKHDDVFKKLYSGEILEEDELKLAAQPLKGVYFEIVNGVPVYLKYSQSVLIPAMVNGGPMQRLLDKMQGGSFIDNMGNVVFDKPFSKEIHEVITVDGIKVGAMKPTRINFPKTTKLADEFELNSRPLLNKGWKLQQDLPVKTMHETNIGSQVQKNVLDELRINSEDKYNVSSIDKEVSGEEFLSMMHRAASRLVDIGAEEVSRELGISNGVINNKDKLYKVLIQEFRDRGGNQNVIAALEKRTRFDAIPQIRGRIDSILMSVFNKAIVKISSEGGSYIQVSPFGLEQAIEGDVEYLQDKLRKERDKKIKEANTADDKSLIRNEYAKKILDVNRKENSSNIKIVSKNYDGKGLKPPYAGKDGSTIPGQVMIPHTLALKLLRDAGEDMSRLTQGKLERFFKDPKTRELVGYRIPNQGMSSNDVLEIVGILPETMGDSIIGYDGIPAKTGSDFDIDKMFIMAPNLMFNKKDRKFEVINNENKKYYKGNNNIEKLVAQNELLSLYTDVLKSKHTYANMMTSIDSDYLERDIDKLHPKEDDKDLGLYSPVQQLRTKKDYMDGKMGVALAANQLIDHVANQSLDIRISEDIGQGDTDPFKGEDSPNYVQMDKDSEGLRISHLMSAFLNAYVDIAKDPYITRGNHNDITANVSFMMIRGGYSMERLNRFIGQPILKEYVALKRRVNSITGKPLVLPGTKKHATPLEYLKNKYSFKDGKKPFNAGSLRKISNISLEKNILNKGQNSYINHVALMAFDDLELKSLKWTEAVLAAKVEKGAGGSPIELNVKRNKIQKVIKDNFVINYKDKFKDTAAGSMREKGLDFVSSVLERSGIQISATQEAKDTSNVLSSYLTKNDVLTNLELGKSIDKGMYAYLMSGTKLMKENRDNFTDLFVDLPERIIEMQEYSENFLIKELSVEYRGGYNFMGIDPRNKPALYQNNIYWAWMDLYENDETKSTAVDLVKYAYSQSGFSANLNQFFTHIPHEILRDEGINDDVDSFFQKIKALPLDENFIDQFIRHEAENTKIVTRLYDNDLDSVPEDNSEDAEAPEEILTSSSFAKKFMRKVDGEFVSNYPEFVSKVVGKKTYLYAHSEDVYDNSGESEDHHGVPLYKLTYKLGFKSGKHRIFEYSYDQKIEESVVGWNMEQSFEETTLEDQQDIMSMFSNRASSNKIDENNLSLESNDGYDFEKFLNKKEEDAKKAQGLKNCNKKK